MIDQPDKNLIDNGRSLEYNKTIDQTSTEGIMEKIDELRAQGMSLRGISDELGITYYSVRKHLTQSRQPAPSGSDLAQPRVDEQPRVEELAAQLDELKALVLEIQQQLKPILREREKAKERREEYGDSVSSTAWNYKK